MDSRNNLEGAMIFAALGIAIFLLKFFFAVFVSIALLLTGALAVLSVGAMLNGGLTIRGEYISPQDGKSFFIRGIVGTVVLSILVGLVFTILGEKCPFAPHWVWLAGFIIGSTGGEIAKAEAEEEKARAAELMILPPHPEQDYYAPPAAPHIEPVRPFRFASWEDEEQGR